MPGWRRKSPLSAAGLCRWAKKVRVKANGMVGEVAIVSDKAVTVIVGNIKSKMPLDKVERISSNEYKSAIKAAPKFRYRPVLRWIVQYLKGN